LLLIPILMFFLPESPRFLITRRRDAPATQKILRQLNIQAQPAASETVDVARGNPVQQLFTGGLAIATILLWIVFFANLLNLYLFSYWMPTVLTLSGLKPENAVFYASMFGLGGILSTALLGPMIDRFRAPRVLACSFASGVTELSRLRSDDLPHDLPGNTEVTAYRLDRLTVNEIRATDLRNRLHDQHSNLSSHENGSQCGPSVPGSRLDADHPENGVLIPRRNTCGE
jgi:hypothetical protein